jgi:hypothetical protein
MSEKERAFEVEAWRENTRAGLYDVRERLSAVQTSARKGELAAVSSWISRATCDISNIFGWLGTPVANTNTNSYSKEDLASRNTNSSSKDGEGQPVSPEQSGKSEHSDTNTKHEEQAP